jgi:hypothetical protein
LEAILALRVGGKLRIPCSAAHPVLVLLKFSLLQLLVKNIQLEDGKMMPASQFFKGSASSALELTEEELATAEAVRVRHTFSGATQLGRLYPVHVSNVFTFPGVGDALALISIASVPSWHFLMSLVPSSFVPGPLGFGSTESGFSRDSLQTVNK